ncbi:MAG: hypothetical protein IJY37_04870 [Clostridia bacterium]|nr:hypothetical protein [Clostridia bacterium]
MKIDGIKREWSNPVFVYVKKHFCPKCGKKLSVVKCEKIVDSASKEAKNYDFSCGNGFFVGNIKFIQTEFRCRKCKKNYSIEEVKKSGL